jgi:hypothetical protein
LTAIFVTIKQCKTIIGVQGSEVRGRQVRCSSVTVTKIGSVEKGIAFVQDLCWLFSFATQSGVMAYEYSFGSQKKWHPVSGAYNSWRPPFRSGVGNISDFVVQAWPNYQKLKTTQPLSAFIHMLDATDISGGLLETNIATSMQCLESIKSYFALDEGARYGIKEDKKGRFCDARGKEVYFETAEAYASRCRHVAPALIRQNQETTQRADTPGLHPRK